jgi:zinc D-Ala-D-Ala dipeptidase
MKRKQFNVFTLTVLIITLQSCGLSGNNASKQGSSINIINDRKIYLSDIMLDSNSTMVYLTNYLQPFIADWKYASTDNFTKQVLYTNPEAFLRLPAAKALQSINNELKQKNIGIKIFDAYRPYSVTQKMWRIVPDERYAANPAKGSGHNRGIAVDLTLIDLTTGKEMSMPTGYDDFSERAHHAYMNLDDAIIRNRTLLRTVMEKYGFKALETEWWHYYWSDGKTYSLMNFDFEEMRKLAKH